MKIAKIIWGDIKDYEGIYQVSNLGDVKSLDRLLTNGKRRKGLIRILNPIEGGYLSLSLCKGGVRRTLKVHRLVAETFIPNPDNKPEVNHKDGVRINNCVYNLEWVTHEENQRHSWETLNRKAVKGEQHGSARLKNKDIIKIRNSMLSNVKLARIYSVAQSTISRIKSHKKWKHIE